jgi:hypothetical protein
MFNENIYIQINFIIKYPLSYPSFFINKRFAQKNSLKKKNEKNS